MSLCRRSALAATLLTGLDPGSLDADTLPGTPASFRVALDEPQCD